MPSNTDNQAPASLAEKAILVIVSVIPMLGAVLYGAVDSWTLGLLSVLVALIALLWMLDAWRSGEFRYSPSVLQLPLLGLILIGCIQLLPFSSRDAAAAIIEAPVARSITLDPYATRFFMVRLVACFIFFAAALTFISNSDRARRFALLIITFGALLAFFGILQWLATPEAIYGLRPTPQALPFGPYVNQHHFAGLMEMTSGLALGLLFGSGVRRERKFAIAIAAGIMGMAVVFTGSRGGIVSFLAVVVCAAAASFVRKSGRRNEEDESTRRRNLLVIGAAGGLVVLIFASVLFFGGEGSLLRGVGLGESGAEDVSSGRFHFWAIALQIFFAHPIIGAGFDAFGVAFSRYDTWNGFFRVEQAHNDYLQMLADAGVLGFACVAAFVYFLFKRSFANIRARVNSYDSSIAVGALAGCVGILIHSFFDFPLRTTANAFFFLLLVVLAAGSYSTVRDSKRRASGR